MIRRVSRDELARCAHFFGEIVGLGLRKTTECPIEVNLLPKSARRREQMQQQRPYLAGAAVCVLLIPLCWLGYTQKMVALKTTQLHELTDKVKVLDDLSQRLNREQNQLSAVQFKASQIISLVDQRSLWPELLQDLSSRLVSNIWIVSFSPDSDVPAVAAPAAVRSAPPGRSVVEDEGRRNQAPTSDRITPGPWVVAPGKGIVEIRIQGAGIHSADHPERDIQLVYDFAKKLRDSSFYDKRAS